MVSEAGVSGDVPLTGGGVLCNTPLLLLWVLLLGLILATGCLCELIC